MEQSIQINSKVKSIDVAAYPFMDSWIQIDSLDKSTDFDAYQFILAQ